MNWIQKIKLFFVFMVLGTSTSAAPRTQFGLQTIYFQGKMGQRLCSFGDVDGNALLDLLVIDPVTQKFSMYRQSESGFAITPEQTFDLPKRTAWVALCDVVPEPGVELLVSIPSGLAYFRQTGGRFDSRMHSLVNAQQVFDADNTTTTLRPVFTLHTNATISVVAAESAIVYKRESGSGWSMNERNALPLRQARWREERGRWSAGPNTSHSFSSKQVFQTITTGISEEDAGSLSVGGLSPTGTRERVHRKRQDYVDTDGDGRIDLVHWQTGGDLLPRTDIFIYRRNEEGRLPDIPTQVLHCAGLPLPGGSERRVSPFQDIDGNGKPEIVLAELNKTLTSAGSMVDLIVSKGIEWSVTVRSLHGDAFSKGPEAVINVNTILPDETGMQRLFLVNGDFNADGRVDVLARRSTNSWDVFLSSTGGNWLQPEPAFTFQTPRAGRVQAQDLNGDGVSDLIVHLEDQSGISVFLSGNTPQRATP